MHIFGQNIISISLVLSQKNEIEKWLPITSVQCTIKMDIEYEWKNRNVIFRLEMVRY